MHMPDQAVRPHDAIFRFVARAFGHGAAQFSAHAFLILRMHDAANVFVGRQIVSRRFQAENPENLGRRIRSAGLRHLELIAAHMRDFLRAVQQGLAAPQGFLFPLARGDVPQDAREDAPVRQPHFAYGQVQREGGTVFAPAGDFAAQANDLLFARAPVVGQVAVVLLAAGRGHEEADVLTGGFRGGVAKHALRCGVERFDEAEFIDGDDGFRGRVENRVQPGLIIAQGRLGRLAPGDVREGRAGHASLAPGVHHRQALQLDLHEAAAFDRESQFDRSAAVRAGECPEMLVKGRQIGLHDMDTKRQADQPRTFDAQHSRRRKINLPDQPFVIKRDVADGGEVIKVRIAVARQFQEAVGFAQFAVLGFQLDLLHLELVQEPFALKGIVRGGAVVPRCRRLWDGSGGFRFFCFGHACLSPGMGLRRVMPCDGAPRQWPWHSLHWSTARSRACRSFKRASGLVWGWRMAVVQRIRSATDSKKPAIVPRLADAGRFSAAR